MQKSLLTVVVCAFAVAGSSACATKGYVRTQTAQVSSKVDTLTASLEATQERTKQNEARIGAVDVATGAAQTAATSAGVAASAADQKAVEAGQSAAAAGAKAAVVEQASKRVVYEVVLSEDQGNFTFGDAVLPDSAKAKLDEMIKQVKADPKGVYFEIEGHTDNVGDKMYNEKLGLARADSVKRYLYESQQIPLHRMNVISYGEDKPATPNTTRAARAQNRRVVIRVLI